MRFLLCCGNVMELRSSFIGGHILTRTLLPDFAAAGAQMSPQVGPPNAFKFSSHNIQQKQSIGQDSAFTSRRSLSGKTRPRPEKQDRRSQEERSWLRKEPSRPPPKHVKEASHDNRRSAPPSLREGRRGVAPMAKEGEWLAASSSPAAPVEEDSVEFARTVSSKEKTGRLSMVVPRADGIRDGPWNPSDRTLVKMAETEAKSLASAVGQTGERTNNSGRKLLLGLSVEELEALVQEFGEQKYRGRQLHQFIYKQRRHDLASLLPLPGKLREGLIAEGWSIGRSPVHHIEGAKDGTAKILLRLHDDRLVEAVGIPKEKDEGGVERLTACVSSQVGCPLRCTFCATGKGGFARNLAAAEIVGQVLALEELFGERVSNVVFMGMGEPMLNLPNVVPAQRSLNRDLGIGQRMMTISTVGVPNTILRLAEHRLQSTLAVSLHAPNQALRERLVPSAKAYPLQALMTDCQAYFAATHRRVSFEYTLLAGVNDSPAHAVELAALLRQHNLAHHVNVIPYNPVTDGAYQRPSRNAVMAFVDVLSSKKVTCSIRQTRGLEANAACGQLRNAFQKDPIPVESS